jgi:stage III sporulation protein AG
MEKIKELLRSQKAGKIIFAAGVIGIALIFLSTVIGGSSSSDNSKKSVSTEQITDAVAYTQALEEKISALVTQITGNKNVSVMITLTSSSEYVYANGVNQTTDVTNDAAGKSQQKDDTEQNYIIVEDADGGEKALIVTELMPTVKGVVIVSGTNSAEINEQITTAVMTALDITRKRVCVVGTYS